MNCEIETSEHFVMKTSRKCEIFYGIFIALFALNLFFGISLIIFCLMTFLDPSRTTPLAKDSVITLLSYFFVCVVFGLILGLLSLTFHDITRKGTVFGEAQTKRMKATACLLVLFTLVDFALTSGLFDPNVFFNISLGYASGIGLKEPLIPAHWFAIIAAIFLYGVSFVFEYGANLQKRTDEIL